VLQSRCVENAVSPQATQAVLVVDDDEDLRHALAERLSEEGLVIITASNGRDALAALTAERPAVVVLDLMLPGVDGWELLRTMEREPALARVPVLVMTAGRDARALASRPVFHKPLNIESLVRAVRAYAAPAARPEPSRRV
jgi:DNA-binding response OmpR family regulator